MNASHRDTRDGLARLDLPDSKRAGRDEDARRLLVIGVDAGSPELFQRWCASGDLPNLARLIESGQQRCVKNPRGLEAGSVWPVFHSGLLPGRQPQFDGRRWFSSEDYSVRWYEADETAPTIWRQMSDQGLDCLLIDPPYTHLDPGIRGTTIVDWGGHVPADGRQFAFRTQPPELADEVLELVGPDPAGGVMCDRRSPQTIADHRRFRDIHLERIAAKGRLAAHLIETRSWDLGLVASSDLHCAGHHLWHVNDRGHPRYSAKLEAALGEPIRDCYRAFDASLGPILQAVGPETTILFFGSHGMGPSYSGTGLLDRILLRLEQRLEADGNSSATDVPPAGSLKSTLRRSWKRLPPEIRGKLRPLRKPFAGAFRPPQFLPDREARSFFEVYANNAAGGVRLNLVGREGRGKVEPREADELLKYLVTELRNVKNADTGEPMIDEVVVTSDRYDGPYASRLPDLLVQWNRNAPILRVTSPAIGELTHDYSDCRSGDHTPDGLCVTHGQDVPRGSHAGSIRSVDFAPTIAAFFDRQIGATDGREFPLRRKVERA